MARVLRVRSLAHRRSRGRHPAAGLAAVVPVFALVASGVALAATSGSGITDRLVVPSAAVTQEASPTYPSAGPAPAPMQLPPVYETFTRDWDRVDVAWSAGPGWPVLVGSAPVRLDRDGIPAAALAAYRNAADELRAAAPGCGLDWALLGAIGRVESNHGRFGGNALDARGIARPGIIGIPLDGRGGTARIMDSDGGRWDRDATYDRAVGPMQFIPGTWRRVAADGDRDGVAEPQGMLDSATSAGVYLCSGHADLSTSDGAHRTVLRYNHSEDYARTVLSIADAYRRGVTVLPMSALPAARPAAGSGSGTPEGSGFAWGGSAPPPSGSADGTSRGPAADPSPGPEPDPGGSSDGPAPSGTADAAEDGHASSGAPPTGGSATGLPLPSVPPLASAIPVPPPPDTGGSSPTATELTVTELLALPHLPQLPGDPAKLVRVLDPVTAEVVCLLDGARVSCPTALPS